MNVRQRMLVLSVLVIVVWLAGCGPVLQSTSSLPVEIQKTLDRARHNLSIAEELQAREQYALDFQEAENAILAAERYVQDQQYDLAYISALDSIAATQRIFRQVYKDNALATTQEKQNEVRSIFLNDPKNPLREFLPVLNEILDYAEKLESGQKVIDFSSVLTDLERIAQLGTDASQMSKLLVAEVTFPPGNHDISEEGKRVLKKFTDALLADHLAYQSVYPEKVFLMKTKLVGYADQLDFRDETNLIQLLPADVVKQIPAHPTERRQFLNQWLSEFRAKTISQSVLATLLQTSPTLLKDRISQENMGLGEEIPPEVYPPYPVQDSRRRICKIYGYITVP